MGLAVRNTHWQPHFGAELMFGNNTNVRQIAILFRVIQTVADDKFIRDGEANVIRRDRFFTATRFIEEHANLHPTRFQLFQLVFPV